MRRCERFALAVACHLQRALTQALEEDIHSFSWKTFATLGYQMQQITGIATPQLVAASGQCSPIRLGVAAAILPTSSSFCISFLILELSG